MMWVAVGDEHPALRGPTAQPGKPIETRFIQQTLRPCTHHPEHPGHQSDESEAPAPNMAGLWSHLT